MFLSRKIFSGLVNLRNVSLLNTSMEIVVPFRVALLPLSSSSAPPREKRKIDFLNDGFKSIDEILIKKATSDSLTWEEVRKIIPMKCVEMNSITLNSTILNSCFRLNRVEMGISYYKYLRDSDIKLTPAECFLFLKLLALNTREVIKHEELLTPIFKEFVPYIGSNAAFEPQFLRVFSCFQSCWEVLFEIFINKPVLKNMNSGEHVAGNAFAFNRPEKGFELWNKNIHSFTLYSVSSYIDYCIQLAKEHKFSLHLITDLVQFCNDNALLIPYPDILPKLKTLTSILNSDPNRIYNWSVSKCYIDQTNLCSSCRLYLENVNITEDEFRQLKSHFLQDVIINKNIYIKTSLQEVDRFKAFLKCCSRYDVVIDSLNLLYSLHFTGKVFSAIKYFRSRNLNILLIGRKHLAKSKKFYTFFNINCQMFLTENLSDDDVFVLYATLMGGIDTCFLTSDTLRGYSNHLETGQLRRIFLKWKTTHQYFINHITKSVCNPVKHSTLPQQVKVKKGYNNSDLCWHLSIQETPSLKALLVSDIQWICLRASTVRGSEVRSSEHL